MTTVDPTPQEELRAEDDLELVVWLKANIELDLQGVGRDDRARRQAESKDRLLLVAATAMTSHEGLALLLGDPPPSYDSPLKRAAVTLIEESQADIGREVLKALALAYADRPGYLEEWRP